LVAGARYENYMQIGIEPFPLVSQTSANSLIALSRR